MLRAAAHEGDVRVPTFRTAERRRVHVKAAHLLGLPQEMAGQISGRAANFQDTLPGWEPCGGHVGLARAELLHDLFTEYHGVPFLSPSQRVVPCAVSIDKITSLVRFASRRCSRSVGVVPPSSLSRAWRNSRRYPSCR